MGKARKVQVIKFSIYLLFFFFVTLALVADHGFKMALHLTFLLWSLYIICIPSNHGTTLLQFPIKIVTGKNILYPEVFMWSGALLLNSFTYLFAYKTYFSNILTHLLLRIISNPWPYWIIIVVCSLGTFYKWFIGTQAFYSKKLLHYPLRSLLVAAGICTFLYFSYKEIIILLNIRA